MIINVFTLVLAFTSFLTLVFLFVSGASLSFLKKKSTRLNPIEHKRKVEQRVYLIFLLASVALVLRGLSWPLFYLTLQSFIPDIPGAMCIYGTTQVMPGLIRFLEVLKPVTFFLIGAWFILYRLDQSGDTYALMKRKFFFFRIVCLVAGLDALGELILVFTYSPPGLPVSCCTVIGDIQIPVARIETPALLGEGKGELGTQVFHLYHLLAPAVILYFIMGEKWDSRSAGHMVSLILSLFLSVSGLFIFSAVMIDRIGPTLMGLPHHHCPYCLLQYVPGSILFIPLAFLGAFSLGWVFVIGIWGRSAKNRSHLDGYLKNLWKLAFFCLVFSYLIVLICLRQAA